MLNCNLYHDSCKQAAINKLLDAIRYTLKIYSLTHGLPLILFRRKDLKYNPLLTIRKYLISILKSMSFLCVYIMAIRMFHCLVYSKLNIINSKFNQII